MAISTLLDACARAFALVAFADGKLSPAEEHRFARFVAGEQALKSCALADVKSAWAQAVRDVKSSPSFGAPLLVIRTEVASPADKAIVMRAGQAALVADNKLELQENAAIRTLAEALGLDPEKF
jgi:tellurite resistance protein TerB